MLKMRHVLVVRLDSMGDVLASGPAIRAVAAHSDRVTVLVGPQGAAAARLLPGVDEVIVWACPWILSPPPPVDEADVDDVVDRLRTASIDEAVILTSFHQSPLPTALLLKLAGVRRVAAVGEDYPGSLLDVRLASPNDAPEPVRMLEVAAGAGFTLPSIDDGFLAVRRPLPWVDLPIDGRYVVAHPGTSAPARAYPEAGWLQAVRCLADAGWSVVVTGSQAERALTARVAGAAGDQVLDLGGRLDLGELAAVLDGAAVVAVANTGPAHLAAAVGTPVVSLFAPVVPAVRWAPYGVPVIQLGDQSAACRGTRSTVCAVPGHPCLSSVRGSDILNAVEQLARCVEPAELT